MKQGKQELKAEMMQVLFGSRNLVIGQEGNSNQNFQSNRLTVALSRLKSPVSQGRQDGRIKPAVRSLQYRETLEFAFGVHDCKDHDYISEIRSNQLRIQSGQFLRQGKWRRDVLPTMSAGSFSAADRRRAYCRVHEGL